jgi:uncharacterized protein YheU (UPF0270 family)
MQYMTPFPTDGLQIPHQELSAEALRGVVEAFILREGTDYGSREFTLEEKVTHVMAQLEHREAVIVFDPETQSIDIVVSSNPGAA